MAMDGEETSKLVSYSDPCKGVAQRRICDGHICRRQHCSSTFSHFLVNASCIIARLETVSKTNKCMLAITAHSCILDALHTNRFHSNAAVGVIRLLWCQ